jgi:hypothetical protein
MSLSSMSRDQRALLGLGVVLLLFLLLQTDFLLPATGGGSSGQGRVGLTEGTLRLAQTKVRQKPVIDAEFESVEKLQRALDERLLSSETAALAQAEMRELIGELLEGAGINMRASRFGTVELEGEDYTQVPLIVDFNCSIERFVNLMADIANAKPLLSTRNIKASLGNPKAKTIRVQLTVSGYLPVSRTPDLVKKSPRRGAG